MPWHMSLRRSATSTVADGPVPGQCRQQAWWRVLPPIPGAVLGGGIISKACWKNYTIHLREYDCGAGAGKRAHRLLQEAIFRNRMLLLKG